MKKDPDSIFTDTGTRGDSRNQAVVQWPHMLRHSRATDLLLRKGQSLKAVSKYLGHSSVAITAQVYIHDEVNIYELFRRDMI